MITLIKRFFFPHESNNHKALLIQPGTIAILLALYLLNQSFIKSLTIARPGVLGYSSEITAQKVLDQTNQQRQKNGLPPLKYNSTLSDSAAAKANNMFTENYWAHNSPSGKTPWDFFRGAGYQYSIAGENLAKDFYDTDSMVRAWMNSPTHRANILNNKYQEIGIGVVNGVLAGVKTTLVVQHFATPLNGQHFATPTTGTSLPADSKVLALSDVPVDTVAVSKPLISPLQISQIFGLVIFLAVLIALAIDIYHTLHLRHHRLSSSSLAHVGFLLIIFVLLLFTRQGSILF